MKLPQRIEQFLQHVAYGEQNQAEELLKKDVKMAQELLTASSIAFTDYSGRTFTCTAYEYAWWAKDTHMCRMLERYMDSCTKEELYKRVQGIEEFIGPELLRKPRGLAYTQNGEEHRSVHFDLTPLKKALQAHINEYKGSIPYPRWGELEKLWRQVGLCQREVPAHIAQEYCHPRRSFADVSNNPSLLDVSNPDNLERQLKFVKFETRISGDDWFSSDSYSVKSGLGFSFAILRGKRLKLPVGMDNGCRHSYDFDLSAIEAIDTMRTNDLKQSLANLNIESPRSSISR